jgi:hypothetical protein
LATFPTDRVKNLAAALAAALTANPEREEVVLRLSKNIDNEFSR